MTDIEKPLFAFGVIADTQYADRDDGANFLKTRIRRYRHALVVLEKAVNDWKTKKPEISFVAQLGDLLDGTCKTMLNKQHQCLKQTLDLLQDFKCYHLVGNHELYNFSRAEMAKLLNTNPEPHGNAYYSFSPHPGFRFVVLDPYDVCTIDPETQDDAVRFLKQFNPNDVLSTDKDWATGLRGLTRRYLPYNGMLKEEQLKWLDETLTTADKDKEKVVIMSHIPICPGATDNRTLIWNYDKVLHILHSHRCVVCCLAGHEHDGGFKIDSHGIYHKTFESPLEVEEGNTAYGTIYVYKDRFVLEGSGVVASDVWRFDMKN